MIFLQENSFAALHALIYPHLLYAFPYGVLPTNLISTKFQFSKAKLSESVSQTKRNFRANLSYTNLKVLKLNKLYQYGAGKMMYNLYSKQHPCNLNQYFTKSNVRHSRPSRSFTSLMLTNPNNERYKAATIFFIPRC